MPRISRSGLTRRDVIKGSSALAGAAVAAPHARQAYAQATPESSPVASPATGDGILISDVEGVPNAYTKYPDAFTSYDGVPGSGSTVSCFIMAYSPPPTEKSQNSFWQELETRLGVTWEAIIVPFESYDERYATTVAGGDIPDFMELVPGTNRPLIYDTIEQGAYYDLTEIVESGKINDYPNLSQIPMYMWDACRHQGKIWGVPKPVLRNNDMVWYRADWKEPLGIDTLGNAQDMRDYLVGVSTQDPDGNGNMSDTFGLTPYGPDWDSFTIFHMFRVPMNWRLNDDGTLTHEIETDEFRMAVEYMAGLYADGAYHPDAAGLDVTSSRNLMVSGRAAISTGGFVGLFGPEGIREETKVSVPTAVMDPILPPGHDGGDGVTYQREGIYGFTALTAAADEERVDELLRICDYLHAPFGSEEFTFITYGIVGEHATELPEGGYIRNDKGSSDIGNLVYPFTSENFFYYPGFPEHAEMAQKHNEKMAAVAISDPCAGLFSAAMGEHGAVLEDLINDTRASIIQGREPIEAIDTLISQWRERGGDQIRTELEEALREAQG